LLATIAEQATDGAFVYSIVVADNDRTRSAQTAVGEFAVRCSIPIVYCVEPSQSIALARNAALRHADADYVAFIDDDELPPSTWLLTLFRACRHHGADGVLGPVKPRYDVAPPAWVRRGRFHERPSYTTGHVIDWRQGRTGNVLLAKHVIANPEAYFRAEFVTGEDQDFFRRLIGSGYAFVWCAEAMVFETVGPRRSTRTFMLKRALLRGKVAVRHSSFTRADIMRSLIAITAYSAILPLLLLGGQHLFMKYLVKLFDHAGKVLAVGGLTFLDERYVTDTDD